MNRDEKRTRVVALPPARHALGGRDVLFPSEPNGGTWVGVNDAGVTLALINWYSVHVGVLGQTLSRGEVVKSALPSNSSVLVDAVLAGLSLAQVNAFRLIGVFPAHQSVVEWRWNLEHLARVEHSWQTQTWISSGFDEPGAQRTRGEVFRRALGQKSVGELEWLRRLHRSHDPEQGPYSHCMHREDAATVSYTEITVSRRMAVLKYIPRAPCCPDPAAALHLPIER